MPSDQHFVDYVVGQMAQAGDISYKHMFGGTTVYCNRKVVALICDNRLYVKPTVAGRKFIGEPMEAPAYEGAKASFLIEERLDDDRWLSQVIRLTESELPIPKPRSKRR